MSKTKLKKTQRGFYVYDELKDINGAAVVVSESSLATQKAVRVYVDGDEDIDPKNSGCLHLNEKQARQVIKALQTFLKVSRWD